jgi:hypothetical protein
VYPKNRYHHFPETGKKHQHLVLTLHTGASAFCSTPADFLLLRSLNTLSKEEKAEHSERSDFF